MPPRGIPPRSPQSALSALNDVLGLLRSLGEQAVGGQARAQSDSEESKVSGHEEFALPSGARGIYGFSVRVGLGDSEPVISEFGNVKMTNEGAVVSDTREPLVDVFDEGAEILVVVELPGVADDDIHVESIGDVLVLSAQGPRHRYECETLLPAPVELGSERKSCESGYLQLRYRKAETGTGDGGTARPSQDANDA